MSNTTPKKNIPERRPQPQKPANESWQGNFSDSRNCNFIVTQANHEIKKPTKGGNGSGNK